MKCVTPMIRVYDEPTLILSPGQIAYNEKVKKQTGKVAFKTFNTVISREEVQKRLRKNENYLQLVERLNKESEEKGLTTRYQQIPCQKCYACRLQYSAEWATRIILESKYHENNYFITLTYDNEHIPIPEKITWDGVTYENDGTWSGCLYERDMKLFLKRLRKYYSKPRVINGIKYEGVKDIKFFYAAEYGSETLRPHYHLILMGAPLRPEDWYDHYDDKKFFKPHWKDKTIEKLWGKGMIDVAMLEWSDAAYVARYTLKKALNEVPKEKLLELGKIPEFVNMSRNPGIGLRYFEDHKEKIYLNDEIIMKTVKGATGSLKPPKAFDKKLKEINPTLYQKIKDARKEAAERANEIIREITDYTDKQRLDIAAAKVEQRAKMLPRGDGNRQYRPTARA